MSQVLVTGGAGYVGTQLIAALLRDGPGEMQLLAEGPGTGGRVTQRLNPGVRDARRSIP